MRKAVLPVLSLLLLTLAVPAFAAVERVIYNGIDPWTTSGDGSTFADFSSRPIPAGFFCATSEPYFGRIAMRGLPIVTGEEGTLGITDTVVQRLDNAPFNKRGVASTRIQVRAMTFESMLPLKTSCGLYKVRLSLNGEQPVTTMRIIRDDAKGGHFEAPISVNIKLAFTPIGRQGGETLELTREVRFPPAKSAYWSFLQQGSAMNRPGMLLVDTDGDQRADTYLPGTSNFAAGRDAHGRKASTCHTETEGQHCPTGMILYDQQQIDP